MDHDPTRREQNMARWTFAGSLGTVAGPVALTGAAALALGWRGLFLFFAALAVALVVVARHFSCSDGRDTSESGGFRGGVREALRALRRREVLRWLTLLEFSDLMLDVLLGCLALYFGDVVGTTPAQAGVAVAVWTGVGLLGDLLLIPLLEWVSDLRYLRWSAALAGDPWLCRRAAHLYCLARWARNPLVVLGRSLRRRRATNAVRRLVEEWNELEAVARSRYQTTMRLPGRSAVSRGVLHISLREW